MAKVVQESMGSRIARLRKDKGMTQSELADALGVTQPVVLTVTDSHCDAAEEIEPARCRAAAELVVKRSSFGMKAWSHTVGEEVTIRINIRARQAPERQAPTAAIAVESRAPVAGAHLTLQPAGERNSVR